MMDNAYDFIVAVSLFLFLFLSPECVFQYAWARPWKEHTRTDHGLVLAGGLVQPCRVVLSNGG